MPNRRAHDHIGNLRPKLNMRVGSTGASGIIENLKKLANLDVSIASIDKIVTKILNDAKFRTLFLKDMKSALKPLAQSTPDLVAAIKQIPGAERIK